MTVCATASSITWIAGIVAASMFINLIVAIWIHRGEDKNLGSIYLPDGTKLPEGWRYVAISTKVQDGDK